MFGFGGSSNDRIAITFDNEDARPKKKLSNNAVAHPVFANIEPVTGAPRARDARRTSAAGTLSPQASSRSACPRASGSSTRASRSRSSARRAARARCSFVRKTDRPPRADRALLRPRQFLRFYVHPPRARHARRAVERHPARPPRPRFIRAAPRPPAAQVPLRLLQRGEALRVVQRAAKESEIPNFKGSYLGRFPLVLADFWTSDHLSERSRSVDAFSGTRARGTLTLKRR